MKKFFLFVVFILASGAFAQNNPTYFDLPKKMARDTVYANTRETRDFYFNPGNSATQWKFNEGTVDLHVMARMVGQNTATLKIDAYGIVRLNYEKKAQPVGADSMVTAYIDSCNIEAATTIDSTLNKFAIDQLFPTFKMYDGIRVVFTRASQDSVEVWSGLRSRFKWWEGR